MNQVPIPTRRKKSLSRAELYRLAQNDPFYDPTPTDDDGVIKKEKQYTTKQILLITALVLMIFGGIFYVVLVLSS